MNKKELTNNWNYYLLNSTRYLMGVIDESYSITYQDFNDGVRQIANAIIYYGNYNLQERIEKVFF